MYEGAKYQRLAEFLNTKILTQSTTIGRVVWDYDEYLGKIRSNPAFVSNVPSAKTFSIKGPDEPDFKSLMNEYHSHIEHELKKVIPTPKRKFVRLLLIKQKLIEFNILNNAKLLNYFRTTI